MVRGVVSFGGERDQASSQGSFFLKAAFGKADTFAWKLPALPCVVKQRSLMKGTQKKLKLLAQSSALQCVSTRTLVTAMEAGRESRASNGSHTQLTEWGVWELAGKTPVTLPVVVVGFYSVAELLGWRAPSWEGLRTSQRHGQPLTLLVAASMHPQGQPPWWSSPESEHGWSLHPNV